MKYERVKAVWSEILLVKYKELLVKAREMGKKVCVSGILARLGEMRNSGQELWV